MTTATYTPAQATTPPRRMAAWLAVALLSALLLGCGLALAEGVGHLADLPFSLVIDGEDVTDAVRADLNDLSGLEAVFGLACAVLALLAAAIIVHRDLIASAFKEAGHEQDLSVRRKQGRHRQKHVGVCPDRRLLAAWGRAAFDRNGRRQS